MFSATLSGGFRSQKFINMDKSNLLNLINHIGGRCLFDAVKLNPHIGNELKCGKSPSTLQQRLYSFSRFINYLKNYNPSILAKDVSAIHSMIKGICVSLTKLKNRRQSLIMEKSREKFPSTVKEIKE